MSDLQPDLIGPGGERIGPSPLWVVGLFFGIGMVPGGGDIKSLCQIPEKQIVRKVKRVSCNRIALYAEPMKKV